MRRGVVQLCTPVRLQTTVHTCTSSGYPRYRRVIQAESCYNCSVANAKSHDVLYIYIQSIYQYSTEYLYTAAPEPGFWYNCARWYTAVECTQLLNTVYSCSHWVTLVSSMLFQALSDVTGHSVQLYTADVYRTRYRVVAGTADQSS